MNLLDSNFYSHEPLEDSEFLSHELLWSSIQNSYCSEPLGHSNSYVHQGTPRFLLLGKLKPLSRPEILQT